LNSSLPLLAPDLRARKAMCDPVVLARESSNPTRHQSVRCQPPSKKKIDWKTCGLLQIH